MTTEPKGTPESVLNHLTEALGGATPVLTSTVEDRLADGSLVRRYTAYAEGVPNKAVAVALSASGELLDLAAADRLAGRRLFVPEFELGDLPHVPTKEPVTIDPRRNDWTLNKCDRVSEKITVTVPPTGVAAKADVYLLADTTGSMQPVLDAVIAGSEAILSHPGLAAYDVAWGVGNYRDFPIPLSSSYAFQHQLSPTTNHVPVNARHRPVDGPGRAGSGSAGGPVLRPAPARDEPVDRLARRQQADRGVVRGRPGSRPDLHRPERTGRGVDRGLGDRRPDRSRDHRRGREHDDR